METIRTKVEIVEKLNRGFKIKEIYEIVGEKELAKKSMWKVSYESDYPAEFCDHFGQFRSCLSCGSFVVDDEKKGIGHCARAFDKVSYKVMMARINQARAHGCTVKVW